MRSWELCTPQWPVGSWHLYDWWKCGYQLLRHQKQPSRCECRPAMSLADTLGMLHWLDGVWYARIALTCLNLSSERGRWDLHLIWEFGHLLRKHQVKLCWLGELSLEHSICGSLAMTHGSAMSAGSRRGNCWWQRRHRVHFVVQQHCKLCERCRTPRPIACPPTDWGAVLVC